MGKEQPKSRGTGPGKTTSGAQFVSERGFAARVARGSERPNVTELIGELIRLGGGTYLRHFNAGNGRSPAEPEFVAGFGMHPHSLLTWAREFTQQCERVMVPNRCGTGMIKRKCDVPVVLAIVASYPHKACAQVSDADLARMPAAERRAAHRKLVDANRELARSTEFREWRDAAVAWARRRYSRAVPVTACVHVDEANLHLHMIFHNGTASVKPLIAGLGAALLIRKQGGSRKQAQDALYAANRQLGDEYHQSVSSRFDHLRRSAAPKPSPTGRAYSKKRAREIAARLVAQAEEESRALREAAKQEVDAIKASGEERARADVEAAVAQAEADMVARREMELERLKREAVAAVKPEYERVKTLMLEAAERYRRKEEKWVALLEEAVPDQRERSRLLRQIGVLIPPHGVG